MRFPDAKLKKSLHEWQKHLLLIYFYTSITLPIFLFEQLLLIDMNSSFILNNTVFVKNRFFKDFF